MVNLLPPRSRAHLTRGYYLRLATTTLVGVTVVTAVAGALLIPTYLLAQGAADASVRYSAALEEAVGLKDASATAHSIAALAERIRLMKLLDSPLGMSELLDVIGAHRTDGIRVNEISIARVDSGTTVALAGSAATRAGLLAYVDALRASPDITDVVLPVSNLVADKDISFSLSLTFTPHP